jgi:hypothetical protein
MSTRWRNGSVLLIAGGLGMVALFASAVQAQVIHPDQIIEAPISETEGHPADNPASNDPVAGDLEKRFDRQMMVPEPDSSGIMDMKMLKTPDATDAENARESDSRSALSY